MGAMNQHAYLLVTDSLLTALEIFLTLCVLPTSISPCHVELSSKKSNIIEILKQAGVIYSVTRF
jgi:Na+-translocating ferredoxin:NAD+ oxidoreductase RnfC subunit